MNVLQMSGKMVWSTSEALLRAKEQGASFAIIWMYIDNTSSLDQFSMLCVNRYYEMIRSQKSGRFDSENDPLCVPIIR